MLHGNRDGYTPDFISPRPQQFESDLDTELHRIATTAPHRIGYEMQAFVNCTGISGCGEAETSPLVLRSLERGEGPLPLAQVLAGQLERLWDTNLQPLWPSLRDRMEADIGHRADTMARNGFAAIGQRRLPDPALARQRHRLPPGLALQRPNRAPRDHRPGLGRHGPPRTLGIQQHLDVLHRRQRRPRQTAVHHHLPAPARRGAGPRTRRADR
ncbi:hypothetical protein [Streptomyces sp. NPDC052811]|uniref:hypothetical protein n=1 Tax=Streptomyces sp. NPDC052811 TaxID=3155731 RepID=UPI003418983C